MSKTSKRRYTMPSPTDDLIDRLIMEKIVKGSRVIDLGCGNGRLLKKLRDESDCSVLGIELELEEIVESLGAGISVIQADLDQPLSQIPEQSFDYAVLSQTLQEIGHPKELLLEMLRIAQRAIVVVPNFGHWRVRFAIAYRGVTPVTDALPYEWYDTPNQRFMSLHDFRELCHKVHIQIQEEVPIVKGETKTGILCRISPNLGADSVLYMLERTENLPSE